MFAFRNYGIFINDSVSVFKYAAVGYIDLPLNVLTLVLKGSYFNHLKCGFRSTRVKISLIEQSIRSSDSPVSHYVG